MSDSLQPRGQHHTRLPCPSPSPRVCSDSCPLSQWCHPTILSCRPLLLLPSIFPSIRVSSNELAFHIRWPKDWNFSISHQSFQWTFRVDFLQDWLVWSPCCPRDSQVFSNTNSSKASDLQHSAFFMVQFSHPYIATGKTIALIRQIFVGKVASLLFNMLSRSRLYIVTVLI